MKKKPATKSDAATTTFRFENEAERKQFKEAAKEEGFSTLAAWMTYHLRRQAKATLGARQE